MIKILLYGAVLIGIFTSAVYLGLFSLLGLNITTFTSDFIPFIPMELRLGIFFVILGLMVGIGKSFIN